MKFFSTLLIAFVYQFSFSQDDQITRAPFNIGETLRFHSEILGEERILNVYLPLSYSGDSIQNYPVIFLLDGSADEDFIHVSGLTQFCSFSWINILPETIVVGISNVDRRRDYTFPTTIEQDKIDFPTTGGSANFIKCLSEEIIPLVEKEYRTKPDKTVIGQSLGGLLVTEIVYNHPDMFDHYMIISPNLWWNSESLLQSKVPKLTENQSVFVAVGAEGRVMKKDARTLYKKLKSENSAVFYDYFQEQNHGDVLHLALYTGFGKLFGGLKN